MLRTKIRTFLVTAVAVSSVTAALAVPAASQAQWHTIVVGGHVFTHGNFTEGGVSPCVRITEQLGKAEQAVGDYGEWVNRKDGGKATARRGTGQRRRRSQPRQRRSLRIRLRHRGSGEVLKREQRGRMSEEGHAVRASQAHRAN